MNKKGNFPFILFMFFGIAILLVAGVLIAIGGGVLDMVLDEVVPEISNLGVVGETNLTEIAGYTVSPVNSVLQTFTWMGGLFYVFALIIIFALAFSYRATGEGWLIPFFILMVIMMTVMCILMSQIYAGFHDGDDELAEKLQEQTLLSFMILYSPAIISMFSLIAGLILFSGGGDLG